jgi:hypothetical protein
MDKRERPWPYVTINVDWRWIAAIVLLILTLLGQ